MVHEMSYREWNTASSYYALSVDWKISFETTEAMWMRAGIIEFLDKKKKFFLGNKLSANFPTLTWSGMWKIWGKEFAKSKHQVKSRREKLFLS